MKVAQLYLVAATLLFGLGQAKTLLDYANEIPACGLAKTDEVACDRPMRHQTEDIAPFLVLDTVTVFCMLVRLIGRYKITKTVGTDDWVVLLILVFLLPFIVLGNYVRITALGRDIWDIDVNTIQTALMLFFVDEIFYIAVLGLCRVSLLFFLIRVFSMKTFRRICWTVMGWVVLSTVANVLVVILQCWPISYNWDVITAASHPHKCLDVNILAIYTAVMGIAQDFAIMIIPLPIIISLNMPWKKRLMTLFMFGLGSFVVLAACFRLVHILQFSKSSNPTWDYTTPVIWTSLEVKVTVIVLCMPTIRLVILHMWPEEFRTRKRSSTAKTGSTPKSGSKSMRKNPYDPITGDSGSSRATPNHWENDIELQDQYTQGGDYIEQSREDLLLGGRRQDSVQFQPMGGRKQEDVKFQHTHTVSPIATEREFRTQFKDPELAVGSIAGAHAESLSTETPDVYSTRRAASGTAGNWRLDIT
ncbi:hypothetical protein LQW54_008948 [Pestalotiopsis sp. IQ-011]